MTWTAQSVASGLPWPAAAVAAAGTLLAAAIPIRTPQAIGGVGFPSYVVPGALLTLAVAASAYGSGRNPAWTVPLSILCVLVGVVILVVSGFTMAYVCFQTSRAVAAREGCTGPLGAEWLAAGSVVFDAACAVPSFFALVAGIVIGARR